MRYLVRAVIAAAAIVGGGVLASSRLDIVDGGIVRGPRDVRRLAIEFTGHEFAEGGDTILDALKLRGAKASFFLTGDFLRRPEFAPIVKRIRDEGHYIGPHSDRHLLYCDWTAGKPTLVDRAAFNRDINDNLLALASHGVDRAGIRYWVPAYEQYNAEVARWSHDRGLQLINFTTGTLSNADYTGEADARFVSSEQIVRNILARERTDPDGLNGFLLLMHIGAGPGRRDKMHERLAGLLDQLATRGYVFVRVDTLLESRP